MMDEPSQADAAARALYPHWTTVTLRFSDQDSSGHINNVAFATYVEAGRVAFNHDHLRPLMSDGQDIWVANVNIAYRSQLHFPGTIAVGSGVLALGRTSITIGCGIYRGGVLAAEAESVVVLVDRAKGKGVPLPDAVRAVLGQPALAASARVRRA